MADAYGRTPGGPLSALWTHRDLLTTLTLAKLHQQHRRLGLGLGWALLNPMAMILIYFLAFRFVLGVTHLERYALFIAIGVLHWVTWSGIIAKGTTSIVSNSRLLLQMSFPRSIVPLADVGQGIIQHGFAAAAFVIVAPLLGWVPWWGTLLYIPIVLLSLAMVTGATMALTALNVFFRDLEHIVPILLRLGFFASPVLYRFDRLSPEWQATLGYLPFAPFLDALRDILYDNVAPSGEAWLLMTGWTAVALLIGGTIFYRTRLSFAEWF